MVYQLSKEELEEAREIEERYRREIEECTSRLRELRPDGYESDGFPDCEADDFETWVDSGSEEWKAMVKRRIELIYEGNEATRNYIQSRYDAHFEKIADDPAALMADAQEEAEQLIIDRYNQYEKIKSESISFMAEDVRLLESGDFRLDTARTKDHLMNKLDRYFEALPKKMRRELAEYIGYMLMVHPLVSSDGRLGAQINSGKSSGDTEKGLTAIRPRDYKRPNSKVHNQIFDDHRYTTTDRNHFEMVGLNKKKDVIHYVNFVPPAQVQDLGLDAFDERIYAGVGSCLLAGNNFIPFTMLYNRGVLGLSPKERNKELTDKIEADIIQSLALFDGRITITNDPTGELSKADPEFKKIVINEPLLFYQIRSEKVHGQETRGIAIPSGYAPVLYRYSEANYNEITTDPIESIHVPGLNYSRNNIIVANTTYRRMKEIQYENSKKKYDREIPENKRTITYEYVAEHIFQKENMRRAKEAESKGEKYKPKTYSDLTQAERSRLKSKIDKCMQSYQASGHFDRYEHKRDKTKTFYAVVIYFEKSRKIEAKGT